MKALVAGIVIACLVLAVAVVFFAELTNHLKGRIGDLEEELTTVRQELKAARQASVASTTGTEVASTTGTDLIVTDISAKGPYVYVHYLNQGTAGGKGDFLVRVSTREKSFPGNHHYRFKIPNPGEETRTGGLTIGLIGLDKGMTSIVTAEIDWENRVDETNENNNIFEKQVTIK